MLRFVINCVLCVVVVLKISSCCEDREDLPVIPLGESERSWFRPYESNQEFRYENQDGDERLYIVDSVSTQYYDNNGGFGGGCATDLYESTTYMFHRKGAGIPVSSYFSVSMQDNYTEAGALGYVDLQFDGFILNTATTVFDQPRGDSVVTGMEIKGIVYDQILIRKTWYPVVDTLPDIEWIYYSKQAGVVRMDCMNGEQWIRQ